MIISFVLVWGGKGGLLAAANRGIYEAAYRLGALEDKIGIYLLFPFEKTRVTHISEFATLVLFLVSVIIASDVYLTFLGL